MTPQDEPTKGEQTRQRIVQQAAVIFNRSGYFGTSMSDIMQQTGLEKGGIYNHFASKDDLAMAAFDYAISLTTDHFKVIFAEKKDAMERLIACMEIYVKIAHDEVLPGGCPVLNTAIESDDAHPALKARAREAMSQLTDTFRRILEKGKERGQIREGVDSEATAVLYISVLEGALMMSKLYDNDHPLQSALAHLKSYAEATLRP